MSGPDVLCDVVVCVCVCVVVRGVDYGMPVCDLGDDVDSSFACSFEVSPMGRRPAGALPPRSFSFPTSMG